MKKFHKRRGVIITQLSAYEVELLASLIMQLDRAALRRRAGGVCDTIRSRAMPSTRLSRILRASRTSQDHWRIQCSSGFSLMRIPTTPQRRQTFGDSPSGT